MERLRCAVIGLGRLGWRHAVHLKAAIPQAQLVAVSDSNTDVLGLFCAMHPEVKPYASYLAMLDDPLVDAVVIASSTSAHARMASDAIKAGKAIFCEKPLSMELEEALGIQAQLVSTQVF